MSSSCTGELLSLPFLSNEEEEEEEEEEGKCPLTRMFGAGENLQESQNVDMDKCWTRREVQE
jgi:hypothetical protein